MIAHLSIANLATLSAAGAVVADFCHPIPVIGTGRSWCVPNTISNARVVFSGFFANAVITTTTPEISTFSGQVYNESNKHWSGELADTTGFEHTAVFSPVNSSPSDNSKARALLVIRHTQSGLPDERLTNIWGDALSGFGGSVGSIARNITAVKGEDGNVIVEWDSPVDYRGHSFLVYIRDAITGDVGALDVGGDNFEEHQTRNMGGLSSGCYIIDISRIVYKPNSEGYAHVGGTQLAPFYIYS